MPRTTRIYTPGTACHIVGVTQGKQRWFTNEMRSTIGTDIDRAAIAGGHRVLARVVMPNHFHIIIKHGSLPLAWMMQRVMQRASFLVRKAHDVEGHVFARRYWAQPITTSKYLRRAIVYTHLNPCKASLAPEPDVYAWSSHNAYVSLRDEGFGESTGNVEGLMMFADESVARADVVANYLRFIRFCQDRRRAGVVGDWLLPGSCWFDDAPTAHHGDEHWLRTYTQWEGDGDRPRRVHDVRTLALLILKKIEPGLELDTLRYGRRLKALVEIRRQLACALLSADCRPSAIARCLLMSPSAVSRLNTAMRY